MPLTVLVVTVLPRTPQVGGQEHFYLEPNNCIVIPHENDEFTLYSSTQVWVS